MYLTEIRQYISHIDSELLRLLDERMQLAQGVAEYKRIHSLPIYDESREREILEYIPVVYHGIWREIMTASKYVQQNILH